MKEKEWWNTQVRQIFERHQLFFYFRLLLFLLLFNSFLPPSLIHFPISFIRFSFLAMESSLLFASLLCASFQSVLLARSLLLLVFFIPTVYIPNIVRWIENEGEDIGRKGTVEEEKHLAQHCNTQIHVTLHNYVHYRHLTWDAMRRILFHKMGFLSLLKDSVHYQRGSFREEVSSRYSSGSQWFETFSILQYRNPTFWMQKPSQPTKVI